MTINQDNETSRLVQVYESFLYNLLDVYREYLTLEQEREYAKHLENEEYEEALAFLLAVCVKATPDQISTYQKTLTFNT